MRKIKLLGLAVLGVLALSVAVAASAYANEYLDNGVAITAAESVSIKGQVVLTDDGAGTTVTCEGNGEGKVGPGAAGETTVLKAEKCSSASCFSVNVEATKLPWKVELLSETDEIHFTGSYHVICDGFISDECEGTVWPLILLPLEDPIHTEFMNLAGEEGNCSAGGAKSALTEGLFNTEGLAGHLISIS